MRVILVELDGRGLEYVRAELSWANPLGRMILEETRLEAGTTFAVTPETALARIYELSGPLYPPPAERYPVPGGYVQKVPSTETAVATWADDLLMARSDRALVCESYLFRADDVTYLLRGDDVKRAIALPGRTLVGGQYVYHAAVHGDSSESIAAVARMIYPKPLGVGLVTRLPSRDWILERDHLEGDDLRTVVRGLEVLLVAAYDGESVVLWLPKDFAERGLECAVLLRAAFSPQSGSPPFPGAPTDPDMHDSRMGLDRARA